MKDSNWDRVQSIVDKLLELPEHERALYTDKLCKGNEQLKSEVVQFLDNISASEGWFENKERFKKDLMNELMDDMKRMSKDDSLVGKKVGAYTVIKVLGKGGMGSVYLAEHSDKDIDHKVAIKIIHNNHMRQEHLLRFKREQKILAGLNHPSIARFYDGGVTAEGFPYMIMEYVDGKPIDEYCSDNRCTVNDRIELFKQLLIAIRYAHENLIIHRDIKPGNVFVDTRGNVKVLDFGISKLLEEETEDLTQTGSKLLTPRYASPEQIKQKNITTASDLYSLGVLFYEILTEERLFETDGMTRYDIESKILNEDPPKPSHRTRSDKLKQILKGDLDAIILKAIRKEPEERYRIANEFYDDLCNYQHNRPVKAHTDSLGYRSRKFYKRNKSKLYAAAGILILIVGLSGFYTKNINEQREQAQYQAERAEEVTDFLVSMLELNNPTENSGDEISINEALQRGIQLLKEDDISPINYATILGTIGAIQLNNGEMEQAGANLKQAFYFVTDSLSVNTEKSLAIGTEYAEWHHNVGNTEESEYYYQLTDSLYRINKLDLTLSYVNHRLNYSDFLMEHGRHEEALTVMSDLDEHMKSHFSLERTGEIDLLANIFNNRGRAYMSMGNNKAAITNLEEALNLKLKVFDENNARIARLYHNMGVVYASNSEHQKAWDMAKKAYDIRMKVFDPTHQLVGSTLHLMGNISLQLGNHKEAFDYINRSVEINKIQHGETHFRYALALREFAKVLSETKEHEKAREQIKTALSIIVDNYGENHPYAGYMLVTYGDVEYNAGNYDQAEIYTSDALSNFNKHFAPNHPNIGQVYLAQGRQAFAKHEFQKADTLLNKSKQVLQQHFDASNPLIIEADSLLNLSNRQLSAK